MIRRPLRIPLALGVIGIVALSLAPSAPAQGVQARRPPQTPVAQYSKGALTLQQIVDFMRLNQIPPLQGLSARQMPGAGNKDLDKAAQWIVVRKAAEAEYDEMLPGTPLHEYCSEVFNNARAQSLRQLIGEMEVQDKMTSPTEAELHAYYDKHLPEFRRPFQFTMRHLILLSYKPYVVVAGDTLESIAEKVSGDAKKADDIRADLPNKPLRHEPESDMKPLVPGEKLLVPMSDSDAQTVRARLENVLKQLKSPADFRRLAEEYSETETRGEVSEPLPTGTREILPELLDAARKTPVGEVSPIFRTKHGFQVIQVVTKQEAGTQSYGEARPTLVSKLREERTVKAYDDLLERLTALPAFQVMTDKLADSDHLSSDTVVATIGDYKLPWSQFRAAWQQSDRPKQASQIKLLMATRVGDVLAQLAQEYLKPQLADPKTVVAQLMKDLRTQLIGTALLTRQAQINADATIKVGMEQEFYNQHKDEYFKIGTEVTYVLMERHLTSEQLGAGDAVAKQALKQYADEMTQTLAGIHSAEEFRDKAAQVNEPLRVMGVTVHDAPDKAVGLESLPEPLQTALGGLKPGEWSKPFTLNDDMVLSALLLTKNAKGYRPFNDVQNFIHNFIMQQKVKAAYDKLVEDTLARERYKFLLGNNQP